MKDLLRAGLLAALVAFCAMLVMMVTGAIVGFDVTLQPSYPAAPAADIVAVINNYPGEMLRLLAADSLFLLSYLIVFAALYGLAARRVPVLALIGIIAGGLTALLDATENGFLITFATLADQGVQVSVGDLPMTALFLVANLKWMAAYATLYAFGLALPRVTVLEKGVVGLMLLFPVTGALGVAQPALFPLTLLLMLVGMPLFAFYFWQQLKVSE